MAVRLGSDLRVRWGSATRRACPGTRSEGPGGARAAPVTRSVLFLESFRNAQDPFYFLVITSR